MEKIITAALVLFVFLLVGDEMIAVIFKPPPVSSYLIVGLLFLITSFAGWLSMFCRMSAILDRIRSDSIGYTRVKYIASGILVGIALIAATINSLLLILH